MSAAADKLNVVEVSPAVLAVEFAAHTRRATETRLPLAMFDDELNDRVLAARLELYR